MDSNRRLLAAALTKYTLGVGILGALIFLCAGDVRFWNGWLFLAVFAACIFSFGAYLYRNDKELLQKRLNSREKERAQDVYTALTGISFLGTFGAAGLDYRFGWSAVPLPAVVAALAVMLAGFGLFVLTLMQNRFASRTVEIQEKQRVIDSGVYSVVRHPMYTAALLMFFASPVVLGSWYALIPMLVFLIGIIFRIRNEEKVLSEGLEGYTAYLQKVKYRLLPFIW